MASQIPPVFTTVCKISHLSEDETKSAWNKIWSSLSKEFLSWLTESGTMTEEQLSKITQATDSGTDLPTAVEQNSDDSQKKVISQKIADLMDTYFSNFQKTISGKLSIEEKQVLNSYLRV